MCTEGWDKDTVAIERIFRNTLENTVVIIKGEFKQNLLVCGRYRDRNNNYGRTEHDAESY